MVIKVSDFIAKYLRETYGLNNVFMVSGGGAMHLNASFGKYFNYICNHHEQACAIAAEGYARVNQELAVVNVTTGPGAKLFERSVWAMDRQCSGSLYFWASEIFNNNCLLSGFEITPIR